MKKHILFIIACLLLGTPVVRALDKDALADSITVFANQYAKVGKVRVNRILIRNQRVNVFANKNLSCMPLTPDNVRQLRQKVGTIVLGKPKAEVLIYTDGYELSELMGRQYQSARKKRKGYTLPQTTPVTKNISVPYKIDKGLQDMHLAVYGSHGIYYQQKRQNWLFQRAKLFTTVEDLYTSSYTMPFLVPMLENAGAVVFQPRERDTQLNEVIIDDSQIRLPASWTMSQDSGWATPLRPILEGENPFRAGHYLQAKGQPNREKTQDLVYMPELGKEGEYAVYVSYKSLRNSSSAVEYTVHHKGTETTFRVNQQMGGGTWIYLGTFAFGATPDNYVSVSNFGKANETVTSDAVRFGGGMGSVARYTQSNAIDNIPSSVLNENDTTVVDTIPHFDLSTAQTSGYPRFIEGARYFMQYAGIPDSVYNFSGSTNDYIDDYAGRGRWINYLAGGSVAHPKAGGLGIPIHLGFAFHSDAGTTPNDSIIGTLMIYTDFNNNGSHQYPTGANRLNNRDYGDYVQTQIVEDIRSCFAPEWQRRMLHNSSYSEARVPEVPTVLLELLSHQNMADMRYGMDPRFRFVVSRAIYKGMLRFIHEQYGTEYVVQPLPPQNFAISFAAGNQVRLTWQATEDRLEPTAQAEYYVLYTRIDDGDWDNGKQVNKNQYTIALQPDHRYDFKVVAGNRGGVSFASETLSAHISSKEKGKVLVINGFNRVGAPESFTIDSTYAGFVPSSYSVPYGKDIHYIGAQYEFDRSLEWMTDDDPGCGACYSNYDHYVMAGNTFDYPVMHGKQLAQMNYSYVSCSASSVDSISDKFDIVDIIMGKQKETVLGIQKQLTAYKTFSPALQNAIARYTAAGGNLLLSGAYISSDIYKNPLAGEQDKTFAKETLHYTHRTSNGTKSGKISLLAPFTKQTFSLYTEPQEEIIHCENPDGIAPCGDHAEVIARYADNQVSAGIAYDNNNRKMLIFGFPLECISDFSALYQECINYLTK